MNEFDATEQAYRNGYETGKADALKWISVKDRLPEENGKYMVTVAGDKLEKQYVLVWWFWNGQFEMFQYFPERYITHWMPLPQPPENGGSYGESK